MAKSGFTITVEKDNSAEVLRKLAGNVPAALRAIGIKAVNLILWQMRQGYGKPIRQTGDLQRDVHYEVDEEEQAVIVGNNLDYSIYVHEGTRKMEGRPYIRDAIYSRDNVETLLKMGSAYLAQGFDK